MQNQAEIVVVFNTCPNIEVATKIAHKIIGEKAAACVNLLPGITSIYEWKEQIEETQEVLLMIKTQKKHYELLERLIISEHPYELPEIVAVPISDALSPYVAWIKDSTQQVKNL